VIVDAEWRLTRVQIRYGLQPESSIVPAEVEALADLDTPKTRSGERRRTRLLAYSRSRNRAAADVCKDRFAAEDLPAHTDAMKAR
jgi:hypothetical protein